MVSKTSWFTRFLLRVDRFGRPSGFEYVAIYVASVNYDGFGVVREFSALLSILVFLGLNLMKTLCFRRVCLQIPSVAVFAEGRNPKS